MTDYMVEKYDETLEAAVDVGVFGGGGREHAIKQAVAADGPGIYRAFPSRGGAGEWVQAEPTEPKVALAPAKLPERKVEEEPEEA